MSRQIAFVGLTCLDIVNYVQKYPVEDSDNRCTDQKWLLGGNAANNCKITTQIEPNSCLLISALSLDHSFPAIQSELDAFKIDYEHCLRREDSKTPTSCVVLSAETGSRTITHFPGLLHEPTALEFEAFFAGLDSAAVIWQRDASERIQHMQMRRSAKTRQSVSWVHFEGRNFAEVPKMIEYLANNHDVKISVELEKKRPEVDLLLVPNIDVIFMSKTYAKSRGYNDMKSAVIGMVQKYSEITTKPFVVICPWDVLGACGVHCNAERDVSACVEATEMRPSSKSMHTSCPDDVIVAPSYSDVVDTSDDVSPAPQERDVSAGVKATEMRPSSKCMHSCADDVIVSPSYSYGDVVDTLGAGDTFVASCVYALNRGDPLKDALQFGCKVAGLKCCTKGMNLSDSPLGSDWLLKL